MKTKPLSPLAKRFVAALARRRNPVTVPQLAALVPTTTDIAYVYVRRLAARKLIRVNPPPRGLSRGKTVQRVGA